MGVFRPSGDSSWVGSPALRGYLVGSFPGSPVGLLSTPPLESGHAHAATDWHCRGGMPVPSCGHCHLDPLDHREAADDDLRIPGRLAHGPAVVRYVLGLHSHLGTGRHLVETW